MFKFEFKIRDTETGEIITTDWTTFDAERVDQFGNCETVDIHVGAAMRHIRRLATSRATHEGNIEAINAIRR